MRRLAVLSLHTSPLAQPGTGDGGGMNVYVRELTTALARAGVECDVYTRAWSPRSARDRGGGARVPGPPRARRPAGARWPRSSSPPSSTSSPTTSWSLMASGAGVDPAFHEETGFDAVHANYWLSGIAGHRIKHELDLPLVSTFHTLARVKAEASPEEVSSDEPHRRAEAEADDHAVLRGGSGVVLGGGRAAGGALRLATRRGSGSWPPGSTTPFSAPVTGPRRAEPSVCPPTVPMLLFVGRIQPLKGADVAVRALAALTDHPDAHLLVVGGPSGPRGEEHLAAVAEARRRPRAGRPRALRASATPRAALHLLPRRRRLRGAQPFRVLRSRGPRSCRVRDAGRGRRRRGSDDIGRRRATRVIWSTILDAAGVRRGRLGDPRPTRCSAERLATAAVVRARRYTWAEAADRCCGPPTRSSPPSASSRAADADT